MELYFLALLILLMAGALASGYPVAFALPGSAILSIVIAAACGHLFAGDVDLGKQLGSEMSLDEHLLAGGGQGFFEVSAGLPHQVFLRDGD